MVKACADQHVIDMSLTLLVYPAAKSCLERPVPLTRTAGASPPADSSSGVPVDKVQGSLPGG